MGHSFLRRFGATTALFLCSASSSAQIASPDSLARLMTRAERARQLATPDELKLAASLFRQAAGAAHLAGDVTTEVRALVGSASLCFYFGSRQSTADRDSGLVYVRRAVALARATKDPLRLAQALFLAGANTGYIVPDSGLRYLEESAVLFTSLAMDSSASRALLFIARVRFNAHDGRVNVSSADSALRDARDALARAGAGEEPRFRAEVMAFIGDIFQGTLARFDSAEVYHRRALQLLEAAPPLPGEATRLQQLIIALGIDYLQLGRVDSARQQFYRAASADVLGKDLSPEVVESSRRQAISLLRDLFQIYGPADSIARYARMLVGMPGRRAWDGVSDLLSLSRAQLRAGFPDSAIRYARVALDRGKATGRSAEWLSAMALETIGASFIRLGRPDSALRYLGESTALLAMDLPPSDGVPREIELLMRARTRLSVSTYAGEAFRLHGSTDSALTYLTRALSAARESRRPYAESVVLAQLAFVHQARGAPLAGLALLDSAAAIRRRLGLSLLDLSAAPVFDEDPQLRAELVARTPLVSILSVDPIAADSSEVRIAVAATDRGAGVEEIRLYDNGTPVALAARGLTPSVEHCPPGATCFRVSLAPGRHTLETTATARDGTEGPREVRLLTVPGRRRAATLYVLGVGIDDYHNSAYRLSYARADAKEVMDSLRASSSAAFAAAPVVEALFDRAATRDAIEARLLRLARQVKPEDVFVFYYAGHGKETTIGATTSFFLVPTDVSDMSDPDVLGARGISSARLLELLRNISARQKILLIDACQSGGVASAFTWQEPSRDALSRLAIGTGTWVMAASRPQQTAAESAELGHGLFTFALLRALGRDASGRPREITVAGLFSETSSRMADLASRLRTPAQTPIALGAGEFFTLGVR